MHILTEPFRDLLSPEETDSLITDFSMSGFIRWRPEVVAFRSGMESHVLVGGREDVTEHPFVLAKIGALIARATLRMVKENHRACLIGIPMVGNTLATAAALHEPHRLPFLVMRPVRKKHGAHTRWVDGSAFDYDHFVTVDNTITDGGSKFQTIRRLRSEGFGFDQSEGLSHLVLVDRGIGGIARLRSRGHDAHALIDLPDLVRAFVVRGDWPQERLDTLLRENEQYRLAL